MFFKLASLSGLVASIWIVVGVLIAGRLYSGYSHTRQLCSELGATGSPIEKLSPLINNYPLSILFCIFGWHLASNTNSLPIIISGWLVIVHGLGTLIAGYFPMDSDPYTKKPTKKCELHALAGVLMLFSLALAPVFVLFGEASLNFKLFSIVCLSLFFIFLFQMAEEFKSHGNIGLYQRLSYGSQLLWLGTYSFVVS